MDERTKFELGARLILLLAIAAILFLAASLIGCSQVQMSPAYKQELMMSNILVQSLDEDCRGGDPNACKQGLNESAKILQLLVDAVHGVDPNGGQLQ